MPRVSSHWPSKRPISPSLLARSTFFMRLRLLTHALSPSHWEGDLPYKDKAQHGGRLACRRKNWLRARIRGYRR